MFVKQLAFSLISLFLSLSFLNAQETKDSFVVIQQITVHFDSDKFNLDSTELLTLDRFVKKIKNISKTKVSISSHTDKIGSNNYNYNLSKKRSLFIQQYFLDNEYPQNAITIKYHGETKPEVKELNDENRRINRRSIIQLIKKIKLLKITGLVYDDNDNPVKNATIELKSNQYFSTTKSNERGKFTIFSPIKRDIEISATAKNHFYYSNRIKSKDLIKSSNLKLIVPKITSGKKFIAKNILFIGSRSDLLPSSYNALEMIEETMDINRELCIEIAGHINYPNMANLQRSSYDFGLSIARALTIYNSLVNHGISKDRMIAKGYGNWQMIYPKSTEESKMRFNRRVELVVQDCGSIKNIKNDTVSNSYSIVPINEKYNYETLKDKLKTFTKKQKQKILKTLKYLKENQINATDLTFLQLLEYKIL